MQTKLSNEGIETIKNDPPSLNKVSPSDQEILHVNNNKELAKMPKNKEIFLRKEDPSSISMTIEELKTMYQIKKEAKTKDELLYFQKEPKGYVNKVVVTSDNKFLICPECCNNTIKVYDLETKQLFHHFKDVHEEPITSVALSSDNKYMVSCSEDNSIKIFDLQEKIQIYHFRKPHEDKIWTVTITPDNKFFASGSDDKSIKLFDLQTKQEVYHWKDIHNNRVNSLVVTPDNKYLISGSYDGAMKILDIQTKQQVYHNEDAHQSSINSMIVTSDNKYVISASDDKSIKIRDLHTKQLIHDFQHAHQDYVTSLAITPDNRFIISGSFDKSIKIFDIHTKNQVSHFENAHEDQILTLAVTNNSKYLISAGMGDFVKVFYLQAKNEVHSFNNIHENPINSVAITSDNRYIVSSSEDRSLKIFDLITKEQVHHFENVHEHMITTMALTSDDKFIISGSADKSIKIFDFETKNLVHHFEKAHDDWVSTLTVTPDNRFIVSAGTAKDNKDIKFFDIQTKKQVHQIQNAHSEWISSLKVTSDNKFLLSSSTDKSIKMFDLQTKREIYHFQNAHSDRIHAVTVTPDNKYIISAGDDKSIKIFDLNTKQQIHYFKNVHEHIIICLAVTSDSRFLISGSQDQAFKIFDIHTRQQIHHYKEASPYAGRVSALALSSDNKFLIAGRDFHVKVFDLFLKPEESEFIKPQASDSKEILFEPFQRLSIKDSSIFKQEFHFINEGIKQLSVFNCVDDFLFEKSTEYSISQAVKQPEFSVLPFRWTILHVVSVFAHHDFIAQMPEFSEFQMPFLLDSFNRTPFHYLIAHKNMNFITVNIIFGYMCDYLEDCSSKNPFEFQKIVESLSPLLSFILQKIENKLRLRFFSMLFAKSSAPQSNPVPLFGTNLSESAYFSDSPVLTQSTRDKIWNDQGTAQVDFCSNLLCLDYDILSRDMNEISDCLKRQKSEEFFKIPAITKLIDHLWKQAETPLMIFFAFYSAFIIAISVYLTFDDRSLPYEITLLANSVLLTINELWQLVNLKKDYWMNAWNWLDLAHLLLTAAFLIARIADNDNDLARAWISTFIIVLGYLRWISLLKIFKPTRNLIQVVITVVKDMVSFITIIALIIVGFSVIFLVFNREAGYGDYLYEAYNVMYGPVDIDEEAAWPFSQKLIMAVLAFFLNVVLLNLLISIMGDSYGQVLEMRDRTDCLTRLEMISEAAVYRKFLKSKHQTKRGYLVYCLPVELGEDENNRNSEFENVIKTMKKLIQKNNEESKQELQTLKNTVQENNLRLDSMKNEISNLDARIFTYLKEEFAKLNPSQPTGGNYKKKVGIDYSAHFKKDLLEDSNPPEPEDFDIPEK